MKIIKPNLIRVFILVLALAFGVFSAMKLQQYYSSNRPQEKILIAATDIMPNMVITSESIGYAQVPQGSAMPGSLQKPKLIVGKRAATVIYKGEQFLPQKLAKSNFTIEPGERALGIPVDSVRAVGMTIQPGNRVDVYSLPGADNGQLNREAEVVAQARLIASNSTILDVLNKDSQSIFTITAAEDKNRNTAALGVAVVKVRNEEVVGIVTAVGSGHVYLVKR